MSFNFGDVVRIGKGKVEWTVVYSIAEDYSLESDKGSKRHAVESELTIIRRVNRGKGTDAERIAAIDAASSRKHKASKLVRRSRKSSGKLRVVR